MKIFLSAGEASGDLHAGALIGQLRKLQPDTEFAFLGGDMMAEAARLSTTRIWPIWATLR